MDQYIEYFNTSGSLIVGDIYGQIFCNSKLSGMPDLMNLRRRHQRFEKDKVVSFIPPDGQFSLMQYNVTLANIQSLPIIVKPNLFVSKDSAKFDITLSPRFTSVKLMEGVILALSLPNTVSSVTLHANHGQFSFDQITKQIRWTLGKISPEVNVGGVPTLTGTIYSDD
ncbi:AP-3 complex subunit mu-2, partial [Nowakowskiella sp. JEL0078]